MKNILFALLLLPVALVAAETVTITITLTDEQVAWLDAKIASSNTVHGVTYTRPQLLQAVAARRLQEIKAADESRERNKKK